MRSEEFTKHREFTKTNRRSLAKKHSDDRSDFEKNVARMKKKKRDLKPQSPVGPVTATGR